MQDRRYVLERAHAIGPGIAGLFWCLRLLLGWNAVCASMNHDCGVLLHTSVYVTCVKKYAELVLLRECFRICYQKPYSIRCAARPLCCLPRNLRERVDDRSTSRRIISLESCIGHAALRLRVLHKGIPNKTRARILSHYHRDA